MESEQAKKCHGILWFVESNANVDFTTRKSYKQKQTSILCIKCRDNFKKSVIEI